MEKIQVLKNLGFSRASPRYGLASLHDEGFPESDVDVEIQLALNGSYRDMENVKFLKAPAVHFASATFQGGYEQIQGGYEQINERKAPGISRKPFSLW